MKPSTTAHPPIKQNKADKPMDFDDDDNPAMRAHRVNLRAVAAIKLKLKLEGRTTTQTWSKHPLRLQVKAYPLQLMTSQRMIFLRC